MKSVLISIQPNWCELIANGKKTMEVRKSAPKIKAPFKCYIYCTSVKSMTLNEYVEVHRKTGGAVDDWNGKVIGEFLCDGIITVDCDSVAPFDPETHEYIQVETCLDRASFVRYTNFKKAVGWYISDLKIYEKPRELSEFWVYNEELHKRYDSERDFCCYDATNEYGEALTDCGEACNNILNCYRCWNEWSGWCHHVNRPPQSWCYVEELQNV